MPLQLHFRADNLLSSPIANPKQAQTCHSSPNSPAIMVTVIVGMCHLSTVVAAHQRLELVAVSGQPDEVGHRLRDDPSITAALELDFTDCRSSDTRSELRRFIDYMSVTVDERRLVSLIRVTVREDGYDGDVQAVRRQVNGVGRVGIGRACAGPADRRSAGPDG